jgi:hypothetical protein
MTSKGKGSPTPSVDAAWSYIVGASVVVMEHITFDDRGNAPQKVTLMHEAAQAQRADQVITRPNVANDMLDPSITKSRHIEGASGRM